MSIFQACVVPNRSVSNATIALLARLAAIAHVSIGILAWRRGSAMPLVPVLNLAVASCVILYSIQKWIAVFSKGIIWYASDQLLPAYAAAVCLVSMLALTGRATWSCLHYTVFAVHTIVTIAAALFFTFFRMNKLF